MNETIYDKLSKRERQIMDIVHKRKQVSVADVLKEIPNPPSYSSIRALMRIMEEKSYIKHKKTGLKYVYTSVITPQKASETELKRILKTHFNNSMVDAVAALINIDRNNFKAEDFDHLHELIEKSKKD